MCTCVANSRFFTPESLFLNANSASVFDGDLIHKYTSAIFLSKITLFYVYVCTYMYLYKSKTEKFALVVKGDVYIVRQIFGLIHQCTHVHIEKRREAAMGERKEGFMGWWPVMVVVWVVVTVPLCITVYCIVADWFSKLVL